MIQRLFGLLVLVAILCTSGFGHASGKLQIHYSKENLQQGDTPPTGSVPAPELNTYFRTFKTDHLGQIFMSGALNIEGFDKVNIEITQWPQVPVNMTVLCSMGKITDHTLAQTVGQFPLGTAAQIHTFDVVGPEFSVVLTGGPPDTDVPLQAWVLLSKENPQQRHTPPTGSMPAPQLITYFRTFKTDHLGQILMSGILNIEAFSKVDIEIIQWPQAPVDMTVFCTMGKITGRTLAQNVGHFPLGTTAQIHTFDVVGPEFSVVLTGGPPDTDVPLQAWVFLH